MNLNSFLIIHNVDYLKWSDRYKIEPLTHNCDRCQKPQTTTIPIAKGSLRGLKASPCECGNPNIIYCFVQDPKMGNLF